jgi:G3E family GTPase
MKKVTILTGFLGAGKTTFLNQFLKYHQDKKMAIIENEFGEENIDNELIINVDDDLIAMNNGCLCCTLNDNLYELLGALLDRKEEFDELVIECTGIADPAEVAAPFMTHPAFKKEFALQQVICLVDAEQIKQQLHQTEEAIKQISFSSVVIINKTDLVTEEQLENLQADIQSISPFSSIVRGNKTQYDFETIMQLPLFQERENEVKTHLHEHHHHHKHGEITTLSLRYDKAFEIGSLYHRLLQLLLFQSKDIFRIKGVIYTDEKDKKIILQSVGKRLTLEEGKTWQPDEPRISRIVVIGKNLIPEIFEKMLYHCLKK